MGGGGRSDGQPAAFIGRRRIDPLSPQGSVRKAQMRIIGVFGDGYPRIRLISLNGLETGERKAGGGW